MAVTFADIVPVTQVASHEYTVELEDAWCIGTVPNGGYVTSAFMVVARTHMQTTHAKRNQPDIVNLHLEFLRRTSKGPATFKVKDVKIGSRISNLHLTLCQRKDTSDPESPIQDEVQGYFTISNISDETGPTDDTGYHLIPRPLPASLSELSAGRDDQNYILRRPDPYAQFRRAINNTAMYLVKPSRRAVVTEVNTPAIVDQWIRFQPTPPASWVSSSSSSSSSETKPKANQNPHVPGRWTNDSLGYISDIFPQIHERFINATIEDALLTTSNKISDVQLKTLVDDRKKQDPKKTTTFWYPTLLLNLDIKKLLPSEGVEWLFMRIQAKTIRNGRFDLSVEIWDDPFSAKGLVALSTHAALVVDAGRNMKRGGSSTKL